MKKLVVICVILALMNSIMGLNYVNNFAGRDKEYPSQHEAFVHSNLPIDTFVLPVPVTQSLLFHQQKTTSPLPVIFPPHSIQTSPVFTDSHFNYYNRDLLATGLNLLKVIILRL